MTEVKIDLTELIEGKNIDSIAGRDTGEKYAIKTHLLDHLQKHDTIVLIVDTTKVKSINDSFWKGFFSEAFKQYHSKEKIKSSFQVKIGPFFEKILEKNLDILSSIYTA